LSIEHDFVTDNWKKEVANPFQQDLRWSSSWRVCLVERSHVNGGVA